MWSSNTVGGAILPGAPVNKAWSGQDGAASTGTTITRITEGPDENRRSTTRLARKSTAFSKFSKGKGPRTSKFWKIVTHSGTLFSLTSRGSMGAESTTTTSMSVGEVPEEFLPKPAPETPEPPSTPRDVSCLLNQVTPSRGGSMSTEEHGHGHEHAPSFPMALLIFATILAMLAGLCVAAFHKIIVYCGCPLGINGCSENSKKADKAAFFVRAVTDSFDGSIPEDIVYIVCAVLGSLIISLIMSFLSINTAFQCSGGGTMQSLIAVAMGRPIAWHCAILRVVVTTIFLSSGGTLGADGPAIQICTCVVGSLGWVLGMQAPAVQSILASLGFACGFAASFNSPIAGILFAMEELGHITRALTREIILLIILASITATAVARSTHGDFQLFYPFWEEEVLSSSDGGSIHKVFGQSMWMLYAVPIGIAASLFGWCISKGIRTLDLVISHRLRLRKWFASMLAALLSASLGSLCFRTSGLRGVWGIGAESMQKGFDEDIHVWEYAVFAICKACAMVLQVGTRSPGDILEPVLISGGFFGGALGHILELVLGSDPELSAIVGKPCLVFGMVGLFSSCFRFPLTPVVITLELMGPDTYSIVLPTVLCSFTAVLVSNRLFEPLFDDMLGMFGINLWALARQAVAQEVEQEYLEMENVRNSYPASEGFSMSDTLAGSPSGCHLHRLASNISTQFVVAERGSVHGSFGNSEDQELVLNTLSNTGECVDYTQSNNKRISNIRDSSDENGHARTSHVAPPLPSPSATRFSGESHGLGNTESIQSERTPAFVRTGTTKLAVQSAQRFHKSIFGGIQDSMARLGGGGIGRKSSARTVNASGEDMVRVLSERQEKKVRPLNLQAPGGKASMKKGFSAPLHDVNLLVPPGAAKSDGMGSMCDSAFSSAEVRSLAPSSRQPSPVASHTDGSLLSYQDQQTQREGVVAPSEEGDVSEPCSSFRSGADKDSGAQASAPSVVLTSASMTQRKIVGLGTGLGDSVPQHMRPASPSSLSNGGTDRGNAEHLLQ